MQNIVYKIPLFRKVPLYRNSGKMPDKLELDHVHIGDSALILQSFSDDCIDLVLTSPPYDNLRAGAYQSVFDFKTIARQLYRVTKPGGVVVWVVGDATVNGSETGTSFRQALYFMECGFSLHDTMIYHKNPIPSVAILQNRYEQEFEYMFVFSKGAPIKCNHLREKKLYKDNRKTKRAQRYSDGSFSICKVSKRDDKILGNIWRFKVGGGHVASDKFAHGHPAIFPEALAHDRPGVTPATWC